MSNPAQGDNVEVVRERALIKLAQKGDAAAARQLVEGHQQRLFAFVWRLVRNWHEAEEICQEAFLRAFSNIGRFDDTFRFSTWLFTIGYRLSLNRMRKIVPISAELDTNRLPVHPEGGPEFVAQTEEAAKLKRLVWDAVDRLNGTQRAAVTLYYREGLSCQEIAEVMGLPAATVKSHLHRGRAKLREMLGQVAEADWQSLRLG
jgi:RNA polymerase sigma-70 factor (ECF subfamily)